MLSKINLPMLLLAMLVILMFTFVAISIAYRNIWLIVLFFLLGTFFMGYGLALKRKK